MHVQRKTIQIARSRGFTLLEVVISLFILAIGILGAGALQTVGLQTTMGAYNQSQAMFVAGDIVDRMRNNRAALNTYAGFDSDSPPGGSTSCMSATAGCTATALATADIVQWG